MNALVVDPIQWTDVGAVTDVPLRGSRRVPTASGDVAIFRTGDGRVFALVDRCPHKGGPLSQGYLPVVQRTGHRVAVDDPLAERAAFVRPTTARVARRWCRWK
jgi:nitrite reductase/ring-hydroxylating ferredoxin subunit